MPIVIVGQEKNVGALASRVLKGRATKAAKERAAQAIREANPGLDLDELKPGAILVVPQLTDASSSNWDALADPLDDVTARVKEGIAALAELSARAEAETRAAVEETQKVFASKEVKRAAAQDPKLAATLTELHSALESELATSADQAAALEEALPSWAADLETLRGLAG